MEACINAALIVLKSSKPIENKGSLISYFVRIFKTLLDKLWVIIKLDLCPNKIAIYKNKVFWSLYDIFSLQAKSIVSAKVYLK